MSEQDLRQAYQDLGARVPTIGNPSAAIRTDRRRRKVRVVGVAALAAAAVLAIFIGASLLPSSTVDPSGRTTLSQPTEPASSAPVPTTATPSVQPSPPASRSVGPPPLNGLEAKITASLAKLGIQAMRAELPFRGATMWSRFADGSELYVNAHPDPPKYRFDVLSRRELGGITVSRGKIDGRSITDRFSCDGIHFDAHGATPPGYTGFDRFLEAFIQQLDCG